MSAPAWIDLGAKLNPLSFGVALFAAFEKRQNRVETYTLNDFGGGTYMRISNSGSVSVWIYFCATIAFHLIWAALPATAQDCDPARMAITSTPTAPSNEIQAQVFRDKIPLIKPPVDVLLVGDSLIQFWPTHSAQDSFPKSHILNFGVGLDRTQHVLWRLQEPQLSDIKPKLIVLLVGTNNLKAGDSPCAIFYGIDAVAQRIGLLWPRARVVIIKIPPRGSDFEYRARDRKDINTGIDTIVARHPGWSTVNIDNQISCNFSHPCPNYLQDDLHFTEQGYEILSSILKHESPNLR